MENLLKYHIDNTEKRFADVREDLSKISQKIDALHEFKADMVANARWVSFLVSGIVGFITMIATSVLSYFITTKIK